MQIEIHAVTLPKPSRRWLESEIEHALNECDAWESGAKGTPTMPANGRNYGPVMAQKVRDLEARIRALRAQLEG